MGKIDQEQYINLETFRKSGLGVRTPVWFISEGETIYIRTGANSGKVKRVNNNPNVNIAPCKANGDLLGDWSRAEAFEIKDEVMVRRIDGMVGRKYGLMKVLIELMTVFSGRKYTVLAVNITH